MARKRSSVWRASATCIRRSSEMSRNITTAPAICPSSSRTGPALNEQAIRWPLWCTISSTSPSIVRPSSIGPGRRPLLRGDGPAVEMEARVVAAVGARRWSRARAGPRGGRTRRCGRRSRPPVPSGRWRAAPARARRAAAARFAQPPSARSRAVVSTTVTRTPATAPVSSLQRAVGQREPGVLHRPSRAMG